MGDLDHVADEDFELGGIEVPIPPHEQLTNLFENRGYSRDNFFWACLKYANTTLLRQKEPLTLKSLFDFSDMTGCCIIIRGMPDGSMLIDFSSVKGKNNMQEIKRILLEGGYIVGEFVSKTYNVTWYKLEPTGSINTR